MAHLPKLRLFFANYIFDASIEQLFIGLLSGGSVYIPHSDIIKDTSLFEQFLVNNKITHLHATPSYLDGLEFKTPNLSLKRVVAGGEIFNKNLLTFIFASLSGLLRTW